jgi:predicted fused transcriptional regulator/phosphomethylpyrimidine kinase/predicted transcriptional regulator
MVSQLLPAFRALISHYLTKDFGLTQSQTAKVLGVTQASVSRGLNQLNRFEQYYTPSVKKAANHFAETLAKEKQPLDESIEQLCAFCQSQKIGGLLCRLHRSDNPELETCEVCIRGVAPDPRANILANLLEGMDILRASSTFPLLIPQVKSQLVMSLPDANNIDDVAGFPSRISIHKNHAHTYTGPEFGASKHLAAILLLVKKHDPEKNAAIVIKYSKGMENKFRKQKLELVNVAREKGETDADTDNALVVAISEVLSHAKGFQVIIDKGHFGIEPVAYIFANTADIAAKRAVSISKSS